MEHLSLTLSNIHCGDCEYAIYKSLSKFLPLTEDLAARHPDDITYRIKDNVLDLFYTNTTPSESFLRLSIKRITRTLSHIGFEVASWSFSEDGTTQFSSSPSRSEPGFWSRLTNFRHQREHLKHCQACSESRKKLMDTLSDESVETVVAGPSTEYRAVLSVSGMTCSSCVGAVSSTIESVLSEENALKEDVHSVNLIQHTAVVVIPRKHLVNRIVQAINDSGFECRLLEVLPVQRSINAKVTAMIGGMTCAACANSILAAVKDLPFVLECGINVMTKSATFVMEDESNIPQLKETVENCGFDFDLVSVDSINYSSSKKKSRSVNVSVDGMFCAHCPEIITNYLTSFGEAVVVEDPITLKHPFIKFTYIPNQAQKLTIRRFLFDLNHLQPSSSDQGYRVDASKNGTFTCRVIESVSMDEHLRNLTKQETMKVVRRLVIATVFAIPTFVFGVVAMSLLPSHHPMRMWVEEPLWVGNVLRNTWILLILSTPVYFFAADIFHIKAIKEVYSLWAHKNSFRRRLFRFGSMNLLVSLGTSVSYIASIVLIGLAAHQERHTMGGLHTTYFDSVVFLTFFLLIGRLLELVSKSKTADAIATLGNLKVSHATLVKPLHEEFGGDEGARVIDVKYLEADDLIVISTGESPPVDCIVMEGQSEFDESALTGESTPVTHGTGEQVFSGTVNIGNTSIVAKIMSLDGDSLIDQIVSTVRDGQLRKAPIARTADRLTGYFVPMIVVAAVLTWVIWLALAYSGSLPDSYLDIDIGGWTVWSLEFAIAVFVIACPCGLGLAAPTALFVGSGLAAKYGILAKGGGVAFQDGANTKVVCFDKTGTLTMGEILVSDCDFTSDDTNVKTIALQVARDLELSSKHPIAKAVLSFIDASHDMSNNKVPNVETISGKGLYGEVVFDKGDDVWNTHKPTSAIAGNEALMNDYGVEITEKHKATLTKWKGECKSVVLVALQCEQLFQDTNHHLVLMFACRDRIRDDAKPVIAYLQKKLGIECWMITGDNSLTAEAIGSEIGILPNRIISEVLPDEKQAKVKSLQRNRTTVAMVGDGINDAPALSTADVGIALASGTDLAVSSSDFILLTKKYPLLTLVTLFDLSKVVFRRVKFNFAWSLIYNMIGLPIAAGVIYPYKNSRLNPVWAAAAMALSSVSVVASSLALKFYRPRIKAEDVLSS